MWELVLPSLGKERFVREEGLLGRAHAVLSLCTDTSLLLFGPGCVFSRGTQHGQLTASPLGATLPHVGPSRAAWPSSLVPGLLQRESKSEYCIALFPFAPASFWKRPLSCCCFAVWQQNKCLYLRDLENCLLLHVFQSLSSFKFSTQEQPLPL